VSEKLEPHALCVPPKVSFKLNDEAISFDAKEQQMYIHIL
jgi:hypothetical protein